MPTIFVMPRQRLMREHKPNRFPQCVVVASLLGFAARIASADEITLDGGKVHGKLVSTGSSKTVALITTAGTLLVFDRQDIKSVKRGTDPQQKAAAKAAKAKQQLTPEQQAWMSKIRKLAERAIGPDRDQSRRAVTALTQITDPDALPGALPVSGGQSLRRLATVVFHGATEHSGAKSCVRPGHAVTARSLGAKSRGGEKGDLRQ